MIFANPDDVIQRFDARDYLLDTGTASAIYLAVALGRPLLLEGEPGVGKTTAAKTLATVLDTVLLRLQCYEGLTASEALYDWNYQRQLLAIRLAEARGTGISTISEADLYTETYL
ncbi:MAG TPA: MoxR family ATPase, partial [Mycobacterium sp.]